MFATCFLAISFLTELHCLSSSELEKSTIEIQTFKSSRGEETRVRLLLSVIILALI